MGVFKEIPKSDGTTTLFYRLDGDRNTVEAGSTYGLGTIDYEGALNKPSINGVTLVGDKTAEDLGLQRAGAIPDGIVLEENLGSGFEIADDGIISVAGDFENILEVKSGEEIMNAPANYNGTVICSSSYGNAERGNIYVLEGGKIVETLISVSESGGIVINTNNSETITPLELNVALGTEVKLKFNYKSLTNGKGVAKLYMNNALRATKSISIGENEFDITNYVKSGINVFSIEITDNNNFTVIIDYLVNGVSLTLKSNFNANMVYSNKVEYRYVVIGAGVKTVHFVVDGEEVGTQTVKMTGEESVYNLTNLKHGVQRFEVFATTEIDGVLITSNLLDYKLLFAVEGETTPIISSTFSQSECIQGELLNIDYIIYDPLTTIADGYLQVKDEEPIIIQADRSLHYWGVNDYPLGDVIFTIGCREEKLEIPMTVKPMEINIEPVTNGLQLYLTAANRANTEIADTREVWSYEDTTTTFTNLNWVSNGWIDGSLKLTGAATAYVDFNIFDEDIRLTGKTIDFEFETHNVSNLDSVLISCWTEGKGIKITSTECIVASEQETIRTRFKENERTRITITIENLNSYRMIKTYVDGILSGIAQYNDTDNFQHNAPVGITLNEGGEEIDIRSIKIYNTALSNQLVLTNYIYDIQDITEKITKYTVNSIYDQNGGINWGLIKSKIPTMYITGELPTSKGAPTTVTIDYFNPFVGTDSFTKPYESCKMDIQGTSSIYYPRKNYQIEFPERFSFYQGAIPEYEYTMKADYMESSHSHNTGNAIFINNLYEEYFPTQSEGNGVRNTIYGFPCVMFLRPSEDVDQYEYIGVYNFNNDKNSPATLGLTTDKAESWEFKNNTSAHCLLRSDDFSAEAKPEENFVARYPVGHTDYTALKRVVSWIVSTENNLTKFRDEFNQYFNLHYCLIYYVMMDFGLLMDSRAKNMFFDTVDGLIWYPRFYDIDTAYGLNNEGVLDFGYGLEQTDENIYNGRNSLFWNNFQEVFAKDITDMYLSLRMSEKLSYDAAMEVFEEHQRGQISEANYNEDAAWKYLAPLYETGDTTYLYVVQGSRIQHFKWWLDNRIKYLDSKYEAPDFVKDYITMRLYTKDGNFKITPYIDTYIKCRFGSADVKVRTKSNVETELNAPAGLEFNDTETIIFGASNISNLGDLSSKYAGTVDVKAGTKLRELIIGNQNASYLNPHLKILSLGKNELLTKIDVSNCPNLTGNLDVSGCKKLQEFWGVGSSITGLTLVDGGDLVELHLPDTITNLTIKNHINLMEVDPVDFSNLQTLVLKNTRLDATEILFANFNNLLRLYCKFDEENNTKLNTFLMDQLIANCGGVDDNGLNIQYPNLQGSITIQYPAAMSADNLEIVKNDYQSYFPDLVITWEPETAYYRYSSGTYPMGTSTANGYTVNLNTSVQWPTAVAPPTSDKIDAALGLTTARANNNFSIYANTTSSNVTSTTKLVIPGGYENYYLRMDYLRELDQIIFPKEPINICYFRLDGTQSNSSYVNQIKKLDLSASKVNLTNVTQLQVKLGYLEYFSINGQTFKSLYNNGTYYTNSAWVNMLYNYYTRTPSRLKTIDFSNVTVENGEGMGDLFSTTASINADNDTVLLMNNFTGKNFTGFSGDWFYRGKGIKTIELNGLSLPKATSFNLRGYGTSTSSTDSAGGTIGYSSAYDYTVKQIYMDDVSLPSVTSFANLFSMLENLEYVSWKNLDTSNITSMSGMFRGCYNLTPENVDLSILKTDNVTTMSYMFCDARGMNFNSLPNFNTTKVKNMSRMFGGHLKITELDLSNFITPELTDISYMFYRNVNIQKINMSSFDTSKVTSMAYAFANTTGLSELQHNFQLDSVTSMASMFDNSGIEIVDLSNRNAPVLTAVTNLFNSCDNLHTVNLSNLSINALASLENLFKGCISLINVSLDGLQAPQLTNIASMFENCSSLEEIDLSGFSDDLITTYSNLFKGCSKLRKADISGFTCKSALSFDNVFANCASLTTIITGEMDTSLVTTIQGLFANCSSFEILDISWLNTTSVTNMRSLFNGCSSLTKIIFGSNFTTANVTDMGYMFYDAPNVELPLARFDFTAVTNLEGMFVRCTQITGDFVMPAITNGLVTNINYMFSGCSNVETIDLSQVNLSAVTAATDVFTNCPKLKEVKLGTQSLSKISGFIYQFLTSTMEKIDFANVTGQSIWQANTSSSHRSWYNNLTKLKYFDYGTNYLGVQGPLTLFEGAPFEYVNYGNFQLNRWGNYSPSYSSFYAGRPALKTVKIHKIYLTDFTMANMFKNDTNLTNIIGLENQDTIGNTSVSYLFSGCSSLESMDLSWMNVSSLKTMSYLFNGCTKMHTIDIHGLATRLVTSMSYMFNNCSSLVNLNMSGMDMSALTGITYMFNGCSSLESLDLSEYDFAAAASQSATYMFANMTSLKTLDLSGIKWASNKNVTYMFYNNRSLEKLDIRNWDVSKITSSSNYTSVFTYIPYDCQIIVMNEACRTWVKARRSDFTNVVLASEL